MSKKNDRSKHSKYATFLIKLEKEREQKRLDKMKRAEERKAGKVKKQKVKPVISSEVKLAKMLKKQLKGMSISSESRDRKKIDLKDSDESSEDEMQVD